MLENAESQNKHGIVDIECLHPVIATFIHIDNEIAERPRWRLRRHNFCITLSLTLTFKKKKLRGS